MATRRVVARGVRHGDTQSGGMQGALFRESGSRRGTERIQSALFRDAAGPGCAFPSRRGHRMRLSVECAFPYLRKRGAVSRKSTVWVCGLTEKRILGGRGHGKAQSAQAASRKSTLWVGSRAECAFPSRRSHRMRLSVECAFPELGKRGAVSRKSTFWVCDLTEKRILGGRGHGKAHSACGPSRKSAFWIPPVGQSAPFRETKLQAETCEPSRNPPRSLAGGCSSAFAQLRHSP